MAYQYNSDVWSRIRPKIQQWESVSGRRVTPSVLRDWIDAELNVEAGKANQARGLDIQQGYLDLNKEKLSQEQSAATISGIKDLATGGMGLYSLGKEAGLWGAKAATVAPALGSGLMSTGAQTQLATMVNPAWSAPGLQASVLPAEAAASSSAVAGAIPAAGLTATGALGSAGAGFLGGYLGGKLGESEAFQSITPWGGQKTEKMAGSILGGAAAGAAAGTVIFPGVGTAVGAVIGGISGFIENTCIIVTACHGRDSEEVNITREYRDKFMDRDSIRGYYMIAESIVPTMEKSEELTKLVKLGLVDKLIEYGKFKLGYDDYLTEEAKDITELFLDLCNKIGKSVDKFTRANGEVV
jgi:hypothetical protein